MSYKPLADDLEIKAIPRHEEHEEHDDGGEIQQMVVAEHCQ